jgi:16S rRNA (cytosine1402-N4)-methyltransferase
VTIAFHSLEDNIIKNSFKPSLKSFPKDIPVNNIEEKDFTCIAKKIRPSEKEIKMNNRSRSAIMRVFQKI